MGLNESVGAARNVVGFARKVQLGSVYRQRELNTRPGGRKNNGGARPGAGRPPFTPTKEQRRMVLILAGVGRPHKEIATLVVTIPGVESLLDSLAEVRAERFKELEEEPEVRERLYRLAKVEVGGQSPDAASAFFESVFNRAAARCQTVKRAADDADYYPRVSIRGKPYSKRDEVMFGEALRRVREGSNISRLATGNASGHVGFAGGPQTYAPGTGERYGVEGPDVGWVREMVRRAGSGMPEGDKRTADKNQDLIE